jgi:hypothetical protein
VGVQISNLVEDMRAAKGAFFVARVALRLKFSLTEPNVADSPERIELITRVARELGYERSPVANR